MVYKRIKKKNLWKIKFKLFSFFYSHLENPQPGQVTHPPSCITELPQSGQVVIFLKVKSVTLF